MGSCLAGRVNDGLADCWCSGGSKLKGVVCDFVRALAYVERRVGDILAYLATKEER